VEVNYSVAKISHEADESLGRKTKETLCVAAMMNGCASEFFCRSFRVRPIQTSRFEDLRSLLDALGFAERIRGDHHIFFKQGVAEILNLQPLGSMAKPHQVKQVRAVIVRSKLAEKAE
jgi:hypothetical protein